MRPLVALHSGSIGLDLPTIGDLMCIRVEQMRGVDALELAERRQQPDTDVDGAVADREDPAVAGHRVAVAILHVERRFDPRLGVSRRLPVGANGGAVRPLARAERAERATEAAVGAVGDDHVAGADLDGLADRAAARQRRARSRGRRSAAAPRDLRATWRPQRRRCGRPSCRARVGAPRIRVAGTPDAMATAAPAGGPCRWRAARCTDGTGRADRRGPSRSAGARRAVSDRPRTSSRGGTTCVRRWSRRGRTGQPVCG